MVVESANEASWVLDPPMERVMLLIVRSVIVVMVQSLTTTMLKDDAIFWLTPVDASSCGISEVVVTV